MGEHVLVADDDEAVADGLRLILEDGGYEVVVSLQGPTTSHVAARRPAMIFLDVWMSGWDGREICAELKADPQTRDIPVVLTSANNETIRFAAECGADDYLLKPFDIDEVLRLAARHTHCAAKPPRA